MRQVEPLKRLVASEFFGSSVLALILLNAAAMGVEATPRLADDYDGLLTTIFITSQVVFVLEILARVLAYRPHPARFFADSWNRFDFVLVALSLVPAVEGFALLGRVLRVLRILRVVSVSGTIRGSFLRTDHGVHALGAAVALSALLSYVFALVGFHLFGSEQPDRWGSLSAALASLLRLFTPDGLRQSMLPSSQASPLLTAFSALFLVVAMSVVVNAARAVFARSRPGRDR
jgi:voltage-gated sodium channel